MEIVIPDRSSLSNAAKPLLPSVSVIIPTYREAANLRELLMRIDRVRQAARLSMEVLIMDDDSQDGTAATVAAVGLPWVQLIVRKEKRGLSAAVTDGLHRARCEAVVVMDADLSHPPEKIPHLLAMLAGGADFVIGSRYVRGGTTDDDWGLFRWLNSRVATLLARPLTAAKDPMAGFVALWRASYQGVSLNAVGYKIGLELIVKCGLKHVVEVPIHFRDRTRGESKLTLRQQWLYLKHLRRLYIHEFAAWSEAIQFAVVGASGVVVNLAALAAFVRLGMSESLGVALAIAVSMGSNFMLHRRFTFSYARSDNAWKQFAGFCTACSIGAIVNYVVTVGVRRGLTWLPLELAAMCGVASGLIFNFLANRFLVFKKRHYRPNTPVVAGSDMPQANAAPPVSTAKRTSVPEQGEAW